MRLPARLLFGGVLVGTALAACQPAEPPVAEKPKRKSFEDSSGYSSSAASSSGAPSSPSVEQQASEVQQKWQQVRESTDEAERMRLANEALQQTQQMAEPAPSPP